MDEVLDRQKIGWRQLAIAFLCVLVILIDGLDYQLLSYVGPLVMTEFGIGKAELGTALAAALIGMALGAVAGGTIGDRFGRKPTIVITTLFFGATTVATGFAGNTTELIVLRFVSGLGFGAAFPNAMALSAEWMPVKFRALAIAMCTVGSAVGGIVGAGVAAVFIPIGGWRACFLFSGAFTAAVAVLLVLLLLESPAYLLKKGRIDQLGKTLKSVFPRADPASLIAIAPAAEEGGGERQPGVLSVRYRRISLTLWIAAIGYAVASFGIYSWTTTVLSSAGLPLNRALVGASVYSSMALLGPFITGPITTILSTRSILLGLLTLWIAATLGLLSMLSVLADEIILFGLLGVIGFCAGSFAAVFYATASALYEPAIRSAGLGATIGLTRVGGILATIVGGALLSIDPSFSAFYISMAVLLGVSMIGTLMLPRPTGAAAAT